MNINHLEAHRYLVTSETDAEAEYLVDLEENKGRGMCSCRHFECRIFPKWKRGEYVKPCKHILACYAERYWNLVNK